MLLRAEEAAAELCERVEDEVRQGWSKQPDTALYISLHTESGCANSMCPAPAPTCVLLLCIYLYVSFYH